MKTEQEKLLELRATMGQIVPIGVRAVVLLAKHGVSASLLNICADVHLAHEHCPLDLVRLLGACDADFAYDICGINRHLDRATGELRDCFVPRFALRVDTAAEARGDDRVLILTE